jgi:NAD(P)-dependent dehydrogenase (short-subunit alcohol dehydrogenase family)
MPGSPKQAKRPLTKPLQGKTVLITGGTAGVGKACAQTMLAAGAEAVVINGRNRERGERAIAALAALFPETRIALALGDMAHVGEAQAVVSTALDTLGRIDVLVNSTGTNDFPRLIHTIALEDIPGILQRCLTAQLLSCRAVLPHMRAANGGCIINIASDAAKIPTPGETVIGAAMAGIVMFTRALAIEGKRSGIRANVLTPSIVGGTEFYDRLMADPFAGKLFGKAVSKAELGLVDMTDLAEIAVFLASPAARKMTGQALSVTGGISAL